MPYTRLGPFTDYGAPAWSAATGNHLEDGLSEASANADAALAAASSAGSIPGTVLLDSFAGASDDAKLTAALSYAAAQSFVPTILLGQRNHAFSQTRATFNGMKISGVPLTGWINAELAGGAYGGSRVTLSCGSGSSSWLVGGATNYDGLIANIGFVSTNNASQMFHHPLAAGTAYGWTFDNLSFKGVKYVLGNTTDYAALTLCNVTGRWTVIATGDTPINIGGSDSDFWTNGSCNLGPDTADNGGGKYLFSCVSMGKTNIGGIYITADAGWRAISIQGSSSFGPGLTMTGMRIEGRNPTDPSYGALIKVRGSNTMFRDTWIAYAMSNPAAYTDTTDTAVVMVTGGDAIFDGVTYDRASGVSQDTPLFRAAGGTLEVRRVRQATRGGTWSAAPVASQAGAGQITADSSVRLITA